MDASNGHAGEGSGGKTSHASDSFLSKDLGSAGRRVFWLRPPGWPSQLRDSAGLTPDFPRVLPNEEACREETIRALECSSSARESNG